MFWLIAVTAWGEGVEFNRSVRPVLSDKCWSCHGADAAAKGIKLRLDQAEAVRGAGEKILDRITTANRARRMPPVHTGAALSAGETAVLKQWVEAGLPWEKHWAYLPPARKPALSIDGIVRARLEREGLKAAPRAGRETLLRRLSLDLTGLAPTLEELDREESYEASVDRMLASPRFAERMAARWLDVARYADTNGYQTDGERQMWRWRDWVIESFDRNKPFDQFVVEQMAGDLMPGAGLEQRMATGFQRNHRGNGEGGIIAEEYLAEYAADRVETMGTVFLGSTIGCARCHNHKYDPFTQKDFYRLFAYFHNIGERGRYFKYGNTPPFEMAPTPGQRKELDAIEEKIRAAESRLKPGEARGRLDWKPERDLVSREKIGPSYTDRFSIAARVRMSGASGEILAKTVPGEDPMGFGFGWKQGRIYIHLVQRWLDDAIRVESERVFADGASHAVAMVYDGSKLAVGLQLYVDGKPEKLRVLVDELNQDFQVKEPVRTGGEDVRFYGRRIEPLEVEFLAGTATGAAARRRQYLETVERGAWAEVVKLRREREELMDRIPTVMVMRETGEPKQAHVLIRGAYDRKGEAVEPGIPESLGPMPAGLPGNRLGLARWLVSHENPLLARVTVNRLWQALFGVGLVKTSEDFGSQGEWPAQMELLDWLAVEFMESGWDVKKLLKTIVMSETYRQSSAVSAEMLQRDPENRLLGRMTRLRMDAGQVRDHALAVSGLLVEKVGGPSVKPYQPAGLWKELSGGADYVMDQGEGLYRRSLYTFWKRTAPPPTMANFDAAGRETCVVRENRTNTPLQALNLMNDVTFLEASRKLAERMMDEREGLARGFRMVTSRRPSAAEMVVIERALARYREEYQRDPAAARNLLAHGDSKRNEGTDVVELAARTMVASLLLNLDEGITRE
ncbi:MAG: PSD1 and planctomycete cytochrome C domain-containing protein [Acidobacteriota bacterium]|jgi:hypothetical protein